MTRVIFGASGLIGRHLLPYLAAQDEGVTAISRQPHDADAGVVWRQGRLPDAVPCLPKTSVIVCLGPLDHFSHWLEGARLSGSPRVVAMSSMSAQSKRDSPDAAERELAARLRDSEQRLLARCREMGSACVILRATLIYGGPEGSLERLSAKADRWHLFPLPRGCGLRQPVHAEDLARAVLAALQRPQVTGVIEAGGGERLTAGAMFSRVRRAWASGTVGVPIPASACRALSAVSGRGQGMVSRLDQDLVADNTHLCEWLGVQPREFLQPLIES